MADDWLVITSTNLHSSCGSDAEDLLADALDGTDKWVHSVTETHWFILDLGATYTVKKVRGRSNSVEDPTVINIYVSDNTTTWGTAVATNINDWGNTDDWVEAECTDKDGRYVKVEITDTEDLGTDHITWRGHLTPTFATIFDVYGDLSAGNIKFNTMCGSATGWNWEAATINTDSAPRSNTSDGLSWTWETVTNSASYYIPSGNATSWKWSLENS